MSAEANLEYLVRPHRREGEMGDADWEHRRRSFACGHCEAVDPDAVAVWTRAPGEEHWEDMLRLCACCAVALRDALIRATDENTLPATKWPA